MLNVKQIRVAAGLSKTEAAAIAGCAPLTWRLYEINESSVSKKKRRGCDAAVGRMREIARKRAS